MHPLIAELSNSIDILLRDYFARGGPGLANSIMKLPVAIGIGFYSLIPGAKKELCKAWLDGIFEEFCRTHEPWQDKNASSIWLPRSSSDNKP